jgi:sulfite exporter TauE/SafE
MLSTNSIYILFFTTGVTIGFGHCIGMCGPIVISLSLNLKGGQSVWPHLFYNGGRTLTYGLLGAIVGGMASFTRFAESIDGLQKGVMVAAGVIITLMGLAMTGWVRTSIIFRAAPPVGTFITRVFKQLLQKKKHPLMYIPLGLLLGLLPCGPVYTALLAAARSGMEADTTLGGVLSGAGLMLCFGLGTIPALFLVSRLTDLRWLRHREKVYQIGAVLMMVVGVYFIWKGLRF